MICDAFSICHCHNSSHGIINIVRTDFSAFCLYPCTNRSIQTIIRHMDYSSHSINLTYAVSMIVIEVACIIPIGICNPDASAKTVIHISCRITQGISDGSHIPLFIIGISHAASGTICYQNTVPAAIIGICINPVVRQYLLIKLPIRIIFISDRNIPVCFRKHIMI